MKTVLRLVLAALASCIPATLLAQSTAPDLGLATLEELMNIEITSVSHKEQRARRHRGRRLRHHPGRHPAIGHDDGARIAPAGAGRPGRANQLEQVGGRGARLQPAVRRQAARPHRRPHGVRPAQLGRLLGIAGHAARRYRSHRGDSRTGRRDMGRERGQRRDQHRHEVGGRQRGGGGDRRRRHARWHARRRALRRQAGDDGVPAVVAMGGPRPIADRGRQPRPG